MAEADTAEGDAPAIRPRVFVSYSRKDHAFAEALVADLDREGFEAYLDTNTIGPGEPWQERLATLILKADAIAFVLSPDSIDPKSVCDWELNEAERLQKRIIPVVCRPVPDKDVPGRLRRLNYVFLTPERDRVSALAKLCFGLRIDILWLRQHSEIGEGAERWADPDHGGDHELLRGKALASAELWVSSRPASAPEPTERQRNFIAASREAEIARAETEKRQIGRTRLFQRAIGGLLILGLVGLVRQDVATTKREQAVFTSRAGDAAAGGWSDRALRLALVAYPGQGDWWWMPQARSLTELLAGNAIASRLQAQHSQQALGVVGADDSGWWLSRRAADGGAVELWHTGTKESLRGQPRDIRKLGSLAFSADRRLELVVEPDTGLASVQDFATGRIVSTLGKMGTNRVAAFSPDGSRVVVTGEGGSARIVESASGKVVGAPPAHATRVTALAISSDGKVAATADDGGTVKVWDAASGALVREFRIEAAATSVAVSGNGASVAAGADNGAVTLWSVGSGDKLGNLEGHRDRVWSMVFNGGDGRLATGAGDGSVIVWDTTARAALTTLRGHEDAVTGAAFATDGQTLLTHSKTGVRIWDVRNRVPRADALDWLPDGRSSRSVLVANPFSTEAFLDLEYIEGFKRTATKRLDCDGSEVGHWSFSRDGSRLAMGSRSGVACIWDVAAGKRLHRLDVHGRALTYVRFSADGAYLATASQDGTARVLKTDSGTEVAVLRGHADWVRSVEFDEDATQLLTVSDDRSARLWDMRGSERSRLQLPGAGRLALFSPTGRHVAVQTVEGEALLWSTVSGAGFAYLRGVGSRVQSMRFSRDGAALLTEAHGHARIWDLSWLALEGRALRERICSERLQGAQLLTDAELSDPILSAVERGDQQARTPCRHRGPLSPGYYAKLIEGLFRPRT